MVPKQWEKRRQTPALWTSSSTVLVLFQVLWLDAGTHRSGEPCHIVYINQPSGHVKVTGSAKVLLGGCCTAWKQCLVPQGRCKVTGATWPGFRQTVATTGAAAEIRMEYLNLSVTGRTWSSFVWLNCTTSKTILKITPEHEKRERKSHKR